ncbi:MAG: DUF2716 domain-containing protein [Clostridia bacterium]|nr:DUF2716 domain-containing protein [Clostridia bacterium]
MNLTKENEEFIYNFTKEELRFTPSTDSRFFLPFSIRRPFAVYDISQMTDSQIDWLHELAPSALVNRLPPGHLLYAMDWVHNVVLYDPRHPENSQSRHPDVPRYNSNGIAYFHTFYPDGDYYFFIEKYGTFGYLSRPWREEVWIYGEALLKEFSKIEKQLGFIQKSIVQ